MAKQANYTPQKRKRSDHSDSKRMCLRTTPARTAHGIKRQRTTKHPNSFFDQLPFDIRLLVCDHMDLPPFAKAKDSRGLYLSCWKAKAEMDDQAPARLRAYLLNLRHKYRTEVARLQGAPGIEVELVLPKSLEDGPLPLDTALDISANIVFSSVNHTYSPIMARLAAGLHRINMEKLCVQVVARLDARRPQELQSYHLDRHYRQDMIGLLLGRSWMPTMKVKELYMT
jgi:hypothetical protein